MFDFGGTLDANGLHWRERFRRIYADSGCPAAPETFDRAFYDADDNLPARFALAGLSLEETVRLQAGCVLDALNMARGTYLEKITRRFVEESRTALQLNRPLLERLRRRFRLGIVSNFYGNLDSILEHEGLADLFDAVADSEKVGALKPDKKLFLHATDLLGVAPEAALMVGDSVPRDMRGAEALGMPHAWVRGERDRKDACCAQATILDALSDLEDLLLPKEAAA